MDRGCLYQRWPENRLAILGAKQNKTKKTFIVYLKFQFNGGVLYLFGNPIHVLGMGSRTPE